MPGRSWSGRPTARPSAGQFLLLLGIISIALAFEPLSASERARTAYVTNQPDDSLSIVDLETGKTAATVAIPGRPAGVALSPDGARVYVTAPEAKELAVLDAESRTVLQRVKVGQGPLGIAVHPKDGRIFVADWYEHRLFAVDPATLQVTASVAVGQSPSGVAVTADGALILTADRDSDQVSFIDAATLTVTGTVTTGGRPFGVTIDPAGERAYTANVKTDDVTVIDLRGRKALVNVKVGHRPYAVAVTAGKVFVSNQYAGSVSVFDAASLALLKTVPTGGYPEGIEADRDGRSVYVACWDANTLERIDVETLKVTGQISVGEGPRAFGKFLH